MKAVIYAAKSTEDTHGSIPTQIEDCRALAERQSWDVAGVFDKDEGFSAYKGNRGPDLERAKTLAVRLAQEHGSAVLVAQDADRFARGAGDKPGAADHLGELYWVLHRQGVSLWSVRSGELDLIRAALEGERATGESQRKSQSVRAGLKRRKERDQPVGPVPFGYTVEKVVVEGQVITRRVIDTVNGPIVVWIFEQTAAGKTTGEIMRMLNADGVRTARGRAWRHRSVRDLIDHEAYEGKRGYPRIVDADLVRRAREKRDRMDPAAVQRRKGGRPPSPAFILRGLLFCACGAPMYTTQKGPRAYVCRDVIQCTGVCTRPRIPAQLIEGHVLRHLDAFVGKDLETWIAERLAMRTDEQAVLERTRDSRRSDLATLDRRREQRMAELDKLGITKVGIEVIERIDAERESLVTTVADIEARLGEFSTGPTSDAILDYYVSLRDAVTGLIAGAQGPSDVAAALADVLEGIWAELSPPDAVGDREIRAKFVLRRRIENGWLSWLPAGEAIPFDDGIAVIQGIERDVLPPLPKPDARGWSKSHFGTVPIPPLRLSRVARARPFTATRAAGLRIWRSSAAESLHMTARRANSPRPLDPYVPRVLLRHLAETPEATVHTLDATVVFVDISGFTNLSERLARRGGREGAEQLADAIGSCFERLLRVAYTNGGSLLKFGGDALLLLFEGEAHVVRACSSAVAMRRELRLAARSESGGPARGLRMSVGVHSGEFHLFVVGGSHRELLVTGTATTEVTRMEKAAAAGDILVSRATAAALPPGRIGAEKGGGRLLRSALEVRHDAEAEPRWAPEESLVAGSLSPALRRHVLAGAQPSEHRTATVAFLRFEGADALIAAKGADRAAGVLRELIAAVGAAADERQVCFLGSDIDADGGKIILTAGAPLAIGDEEERMLLVLRRIIDDGLPLPVRIGVHRGALFAGDIGPHYRRTYTVMGDVVNLAARLMAKAPPGEIFATAAVVDRSPSRFRSAPLEPFIVKGKVRPVHALSIGPVRARRGKGDSVPIRFPLIGRDHELALLARALDDASRGQGRLIELVSEPGMGRSRLMEELRDGDVDFRALHVTCEAHATATPYRAWRGLLRELAGVGWEDPDEAALERLRRTLTEEDPALLPWLPLLAIAFDMDAPATAEVEQLAPAFRAPKLREVILRFVRGRLPGWALIEFEDAHLMDEASAELLHTLEQELPLLPWLVVVTRRDTETGFVAAPGPHLVRLELTPLDPDETLALAHAVTESSPLPPHVVRTAAERSGGSPQFLRDLLRAAAAGSSDLPDSVEAAATTRMDRLGPADRELIRRASVLGVSFDPHHLEALLGGDVPAPTDETWERLAAYFAHDGHGNLRFRRRLVCDVAYAGMPFRVRRELHAAAGMLLERELGPDADDEAARLCVHFLLAGQHATAWRYARLAAERAADSSAFADAAQLYRRAVEAASHFDAPAGEVGDVLEALGDSLARTGELGDADLALRAARRLAGSDPLREGGLLLRHAEVAERAGRVLPAVRWARRALRALDGLDDQPARACRARTLSVLATVRQRQGRMEQAITLCREAIHEAEAAGEDRALAHACFILDWALYDSGRPQEATHSHRSLEIYERLGEFDRQAAVLNNLGGFAYHRGRWDEAVALYRRAAEGSQRAGDVANAAFGDCNVGEVLSDQGRWAEAEEALRHAIRIWRGSSYEWGSAFATALLGRTAVRAGRHSEGLELLEASLRDLRRLGAMSDAALVEAYIAEAHAFRHEPERALVAADRLLRDARRTAPLLHRVRAFALAQRGALHPAEHALEASLAEAQAQGSDFEVAVTLDAIERLRDGHDGDLRTAGQRRRDALLAQLDVAAVPAPPLAPTSPALTHTGARAG